MMNYELWIMNYYYDDHVYEDGVDDDDVDDDDVDDVTGCAMGVLRSV